jgi:purine-binding chemotaxis protein CheW
MGNQAIHGPLEISRTGGTGVDQYLTFLLAGEEYGVNILRVQEIRGWDAVTPIPNTPSYLLGVMNLRGAIVPIVDLRRRLGMEQVEFGKTTVVIVLKTYSRGGEKTMGFVVDAVSEVYNVSGEALKPPPDFGAMVGTEFVQGLATMEGKTLILLDIDHLVDGDATPGSTISLH